MKIIIAGGSGFLGSEIEKYFGNKHQVFILSRNPGPRNQIYWDGKNLDDAWVNILEGSDVLINLSGKSVDCRYNEKNKNLINSSRVESTRVLHQAIQKLNKPPQLWINAASATIYIHAENQDMNEHNEIFGDDFSTNICKNWENEFFMHQYNHIRQVALRISFVLGRSGGAFPKLNLLSKIGLGGKQGNGSQYVSWIHIDDFLNAIAFIIENKAIEGAINITAPKPVNNETFMSKLRNYNGALFSINAPVYLLELASLFMRTETELILKSRRVIPARLLEFGFNFKYENIDDAFKELSK